MTHNTNHESVQYFKDLNNSFSEIAIKKSEYEEVKNDFQISFKESINEIAKKIFLAIPSLKEIFWHQYSLYFNDGDFCPFTIHNVFFLNKSIDQHVVHLDDFEPSSNEDWCFELSYKWHREAKIQLAKNHLEESEVLMLVKFIDTINKNSEFMEQILGNDKLVIINENGIKLEEFTDHH